MDRTDLENTFCEECPFASYTPPSFDRPGLPGEWECPADFDPGDSSCPYCEEFLEELEQLN